MAARWLAILPSEWCLYSCHTPSFGRAWAGAPAHGRASPLYLHALLTLGSRTAFPDPILIAALILTLHPALHTALVPATACVGSGLRMLHSDCWRAGLLSCSH